MGYSCQWILSAFGTNDHQHEEVSCIMTSKKRSSMAKETKGSVAHCSQSQDIALFKFQLSYHSNPLQDTCPITSAVLGHLIRTRVPSMFLNWDKKSYQLCENVQHCKGYKIVSLVWYILLCALCNHTESRIATD